MNNEFTQRELLILAECMIHEHGTRKMKRAFIVMGIVSLVLVVIALTGNADSFIPAVAGLQ